MHSVHTPEDPYGGFNDYDHAYDLQTAYDDKEFVQAVARTSHGRRPVTGNRLATAAATAGIPVSRMGTTDLRSAIGTRRGETARPMTAVKAAGYSSMLNRKSNFVGVVSSGDKKVDAARQKMLKLESRTFALLRESIMAYEAKDFKRSLEKAREAGRKEREAAKQREQHRLGDVFADLTFVVLSNLAQQYLANGMLNDALNTYQVIVREPMYETGGRFKINIGNIYFRKKDYIKALKYYRMALDRVPQYQARMRVKIMNNIGVTLVKLGKYEDAMATFEECMDTCGEYSIALNLVLSAYCLDDDDKMREAFQRLVDIPTLVDDDAAGRGTEGDILTSAVIKNDALRVWERSRRQQAERTILTAAKIISPRIAGSFDDGYAWCVDTIKTSVYSALAIELEINKAGDLLRMGHLDAAVETLAAFNNRDSKVGTAAANNLALVNYYKGEEKLADAVQLAEQALSLDRYNAYALVNRGNLYHATGDAKSALQCYREALQVDASCIQALFNIGAVARENGDFEQALQVFYKLKAMLHDDPQVTCQLAAIYEALEDTQQAVELISNLDDDIDPAMSAKLGQVHDSEGDKAVAFSAYYNSFRMFPANLRVIEWLGAYYLDTQFPDKAVRYFEKAALIEPDNIKWQLLMASCQRRTGNFQRALELYKRIHRRFPTNEECLKFLVQLCRDLRLPEESDYMHKLNKLEDTTRLRVQRDTDSSQGKQRSAGSTHSLRVDSATRPMSTSSRSSLRTAQSARLLLEAGGDEFQATKRDLDSADLSYKDPVGAAPLRPQTGKKKISEENSVFDDVDILEDDLLPGL